MKPCDKFFYAEPEVRLANTERVTSRVVARLSEMQQRGGRL